MATGRSGKYARTLGHNCERYYCTLFKEWFPFCTTSRLGSRLYDNAKIDLINLPFNLQIKAGSQKSMNPGKELFDMTNMIVALFPPDDSVHAKPRFLVHKKPTGRGKRATPEHEILYMSRRQFEEYQKLNKDLKPHFEKTFKFELNSEFKYVVAITFEVFREQVIKKFFIENGINSNTAE